MKSEKLKAEDKIGDFSFSFALCTLYFVLSCIFVLVFCVSAAAQKVAILTPGKQSVPEFAEIVSDTVGKTLAVLDASMGDAAFRASKYGDPFNMTTEESKTAGRALGCDFFVLIRTETQRRTSPDRPELYESYAAIYVVNSRSGRLIHWLISTAEAEKDSDAARKLLRKTVSVSSEIIAAVSAQKRANYEPKPVKLEELPAENSAEAKNFRAPIPYRRIKPEYTKTAFLYSVTATVEILVDLDASGIVTRTEVVRWAGFGLDESVVKAVLSMNWRAAERGGKPLPIRVLLRYNFKKTDRKP